MRTHNSPIFRPGRTPRVISHPMVFSQFCWNACFHFMKHWGFEIGEQKMTCWHALLIRFGYSQWIVKLWRLRDDPRP